jgi:uncharacterized protein (TIGR02147 family)
MKSIYSYSDYKIYLKALETGDLYKGFRSRLAECTQCQNAFVSQVLNGDVNFNLEQGLRIAQFLNLNQDEKQFFLWMIEHRRAGTSDLKKYFHDLMSQLRERNLTVKEQIKIGTVLSSEAQAKYYSSWIYAAIHIAVMVPTFNTVQKLAQIFQLNEDTVNAAANFLVENGLLTWKGPHLKSGHIQIHISSKSPHSSKHHTNWRIQALKSLDSPQKSDMHYSGVSSLSMSDVEHIRAMLVDTIANYIKFIEKSPEETVYTLNLDFFKLA